MTRACLSAIALLVCFPAFAVEVCDTNTELPPFPTRGEFQCVVDTGIGPDDPPPTPPSAPDAGNAAVFPLDLRHQTLYLHICTDVSGVSPTLPNTNFATYTAKSAGGSTGTLQLSHQREFGQDVVVGQWQGIAGGPYAVAFVFSCSGTPWTERARMEIVTVIDGIEVRSSGRVLATFPLIDDWVASSLPTPVSLAVQRFVRTGIERYSISTIVTTPPANDLRRQ